MWRRWTPCGAGSRARVAALEVIDRRRLVPAFERELIDLVALPAGAYRSRGLRLVLGTTALGVAGGAAWLVNAVKQRVAFYERCQQEEHAELSQARS